MGLFGSKSYKPNLNNVGTICQKFMSFQKNNEMCFSMFFQEQNVNLINIYLVSIQYFSEVVSILVSGNLDPNPMSILQLKRSTKYKTQKEADFWEAVNQYDHVMTQLSAKYSEESLDSASSLGGEFLGSYAGIVTAPIVNVEKCKRLGLEMYKTCGANVNANPAINQMINKELDELIYFVESFMV